MLQRESGVFVSSGSTENSANSDMRYRLDTVTYTSPEFDEMETSLKSPSTKTSCGPPKSRRKRKAPKPSSAFRPSSTKSKP